MLNHSLWAIAADMAAEFFDRLQLEAKSRQDLFAEPKSLYETKNGIAIISIDGAIGRKASWLWTGQDLIRQALEQAISDPQIKAILLSINSPGGVVSGTKELADYIATCEKPIAAYADGLCASAAYWLASATGAIYAPITAQVGSIGVIAIISDITQANAEMGIRRVIIQSGKWKAAGIPDKELTEAEAAMFQKQLDALHAIFSQDVARNMKINATPPCPWAEGQTFLASEAKELGLVTKIVQDVDEALAALSLKIAKGEKIMTLQELKAENPQLVDEILAEAAKQAEAEKLEAISEQGVETLALVRMIAGDEIAAKLEAAQKAGISVAQLKALAPLFASAEKPGGGEAAKSGEILNALRNAHGQALPSAQAPQTGRLLADAIRRSK